MKKAVVLAVSVAVVTLCGCGKKEKKELASDGMKCGAGKCGASMASGNLVLEKKRTLILKQLRKDDPRESCVLNATSAKTLYACLRNQQTGRISSKCQVAKQTTQKRSLVKFDATKRQDNTTTPAMKCEAGKCGS